MAKKPNKLSFILLQLFFLVLMTLLSTNAVLGAEQHPKIIYFYDGDTVKIKDGNVIYKLRITEMDAPERTQPYGLKARRALIKLCENAEISIVINGTDRYQRRLGQLYCDSQAVSAYMVANGHAWSEGKYAKEKAMIVAEKNAKAHQLGLWKTDHPMPPWVWRKKLGH